MGSSGKPWLRCQSRRGPNVIPESASQSFFGFYRYIYRNQRDARGIGLIGEHRGNMLVDLELDYQIQLIAREFICIAQGGGTVIAIVEHDQIDPPQPRKRP